MTTKYPTWNVEALEITRTAIHNQDVLMTGIGHCLADIKKQDYDQFKIDRSAIPFVASLLVEACDALLELKNGSTGAKPKWWLWAEDVKYFALQVQRCMPIIETERRRNDWDRIKARLEEMQAQCFKWQRALLDIRPKDDLKEIYVSQKSVIEWDSLVETIEMGSGDFYLTANGFRYRKTRS